MVADLNMNLEIIVMPTVREPDGLAMSSRNVFLSSEQRRAAAVIYKALVLAQELWAKGERDAEKIREQMRALIQTEPLAIIDYVSIADTGTLDEMEKVKTPAVVSLAVKMGRVRLIDNVVVG
jgi:pantoate--beta-alanine ligase